MQRQSGRLALVISLMIPAMSLAGEDHFLLMFGSQQVPADPRYSHTFATFVRATWEGDDPCPKNPTLEMVTISWLAASLEVRLWTVFPECGTNLDLPTTLNWCENNCMRVSLWGPYRICPDLYRFAQRQAATLESGAVLYKAVDTGRKTDRVSNCIHACSSIVGGYRLRIASPGWGETASYAVLQRYERYVLEPGVTHPWVGSALGLDQHPIIHRDWASPRSGFFGPVFRALGSERNLEATYGPPVR